MQTDQFKKICWNCDAQIFPHEESCPYCGTSMDGREGLSGPGKEDALELESSLASLYKPPYSIRNQEPIQEENRQYTYQRERQELTEKSKDGKELWSLLCLSCGGYLLTLGLLIFFFSDEGYLTLRWKSSTWILYSLLSIPFLASGTRILKKMSRR